jgi:hypothetical protein
MAGGAWERLMISVGTGELPAIAGRCIGSRKACVSLREGGQGGVSGRAGGTGPRGLEDLEGALGPGGSGGLERGLGP